MAVRYLWVQKLENPAVLAAIVAGLAGIGVAFASAISGAISAAYQAESDKAKIKTAIVIELIKNSNEERKKRTRAMIQSGILADPDGTICRAFVNEGCPLTPLAPNSPGH